MRILICQLRNHGDIIRIFPLIEAIKQQYPGWYIGFTCFEEMVNTCKLCENIDVIISQPRFQPVTDTQDGTRVLDCNIFEGVVEKVRDEHFDLYVDLHGVFQSAMFGVLCNIPRRLGRSRETAKDGAQYFYTDICQIKDREINRMERHFRIMQHLYPEIEPANKKNCDNKKQILLFPGSSVKGILKRWPINNYIELGKMLADVYDVKYVVGPEETDLQYELQDIQNAKTSIITGWDRICDEIERSKVVVSNDTAYAHLAIWKNIPTIMICGPTSATINGVWKYGIGTTVKSNTDCNCANVWKGTCDNNHKCMRTLEVETVFGEIIKI